MKKAIIIVGIIVLVILFFPKNSGHSSSSQLAYHEECSCVGIETRTGFIGGSNSHCLGIPYSCKRFIPACEENSSAITGEMREIMCSYK